MDASDEVVDDGAAAGVVDFGAADGVTHVKCKKNDRTKNKMI
jgi:hypothetical protein